jgi:DNA-directed RNA polymerase subunit beta
MSANDSEQNLQNYFIKFYLPIQLIYKKLIKTKIQNILFGEIPLMTERGTFIINGYPRVLLNQVIKSSGIFFYTSFDENNVRIIKAVVRNDKGSCITFYKKKDLIWAKTKQNKKIPLFILLESLGITKKKIFYCIQNKEWVKNSFLFLNSFSNLNALNNLKIIIKTKTIENILIKKFFIKEIL